jgi:hypothetical protein
MFMKSNHLPLIVLVFVLMLATASQAAVVRFRTTGSYTDGGGGQHPWSINEMHCLIWDSAPYIPVGTVFTAKSMAPGSTEDSFRADVTVLEAMKAKGITDVILRSSAAFTSCSPQSLQRMVDFLDRSGFTYGVQIDDGPAEPLSGFVISPNVYRMDGPSNEAVFTWNWPSVDAAIYVVVNKLDMEVEATGGAQIKDGKVIVTLRQPLSPNQVLTVYPRKQFRTANGGVVGDLWSGFGGYRDRLLDFLKQVKFGPGLRFFMEPFTSKVDFTGEDANLVPDSAKFRLGFEAYLSRKYVQEGAINAAWGLNDTIDSFETASRLIPFWGAGRGVAVAYDRASAKRYPVDSGSSQLWRDLSDYRDSSAQEYMNTISDTIKKHVANVPVLFKCPRYHRLYANPYGIGGFDGLGAVAYGTDESLVTRSAGPAYALTEEAGKSTWFMAAATGPVSGSYQSETAMSASLDLLREIGCKGFFVDCISDASSAQIDWLKGFKDRIAKARIAEFSPTVLEYPAYGLTGAYVKRVARDTWWLPSLKVGKPTFVGDGLGAYAMMGDDRVFIWSSTGKKTVTLKMGPVGTPSQEFPERIVYSKNKSASYTLALSDVPVVLRGVDASLVFPVESAQAEVDKLAAMIPEADKLKINVQKAREALDRAKTVIAKGQPLIAFGIAQTALQDLMSSRGAALWIEGESSTANNFTATQAVAGSSANLALVLDTADDPPMSPYGAYFAFDAPVNSSYELWIAGTPTSLASPASYSVDDMGWISITPDAGSVQDYAPGLAWYKIGSANLTPGRHTLRIRVDGRRSQDNRYFFALDAFVVSPLNFKPNGLAKPF